VMMAEILIGRRGRMSPINSMAKLAKEAQVSRRWGYLGVIGALAGFLIMSFYSVVAGWALYYVYKMASGAFVGATGETAGGIWQALTSDPLTLLGWHTLFTALVVVVPIITPVAIGYDVNMVHLGIIFLANMQIGYLTPPLGMGLFISSYRFNKGILQITAACLPFIAMLVGSVLVITYWPDLSLWLVRVTGVQ